MNAKTLFIPLLCALGSLLAACSPQAQQGASRPAASEAAAAGEKIKVLTTFTVIADMARNVAGEAAEVESVTKAGAEVHGYEPTPKDIAKIRDADLILHNGMNLERWFERFYQDARDTPAVVVSAGIEPIEVRAGPYRGQPNPHAWMSPANALVYVENIKNALIERDPANAAVYTRNAEAYGQAIRDLDQPLRAKLAAIPPEQRWLVTSEGAFSYLARDYGLKEAYLWDINAEQQGTPQQVKALIDTVRQHKIPVVFSESTLSDQPARQVAKETGAHYGGVLYVDSLSEAGGPVPTYLDLLETTVSTVVKGFDEAKRRQ